MNSTNAIEKALQKKIDKECREIVDRFIFDLKELSDKYGSTWNTYYFKKQDYTFMVDGTDGVSNVLHRMILDNHGNSMLKYKSKELLNKLELI